jgi:hypothetical protein
MTRSAILFVFAAIVGCHGPEEHPLAAPAEVVGSARPAAVRGGRMQLDDALALCLCDPSVVGACFDDGQACHSPQSPATPAEERVRHFVAKESAFAISSNRPRFTPIDPSELRFLGKLEDGKPVCEDGVRGRVGHLRRGLRRAPPGLLGESRHVWDEAAYETVAWCGPDLGSTVLR